MRLAFLLALTALSIASPALAESNSAKVAGPVAAAEPEAAIPVR
jgi:hypothetical protein